MRECPQLQASLPSHQPSEQEKVGLGTLGEAHYCPVASVLLLWVRWLQCLCLELPSTQTEFLNSCYVCLLEVLVPRAAGGWAYLGLGICCWALGRQLISTYSVLQKTGQTPPFPKAQQWDLEQHPQLLWAFFYHCPNGALQNLPSPLQTAESQQDGQRPVTEVFWARICERDENADELTDPWVSSGVSAPHHRDSGWKGRQLLTSADQCTRWPPTRIGGAGSSSEKLSYLSEVAQLPGPG